MCAVLPCLVRCLVSCLALITHPLPSAHAQRLTPALFNPERGSFVAPQDLPLQKTAGEATDPTDTPSDPNAEAKPRERDRPAPSRIGQIPTYGLPAANGAASSGYDSLNRRRKPPKYYPGQARPKPPPGPGTPPPSTAAAGTAEPVGAGQKKTLRRCMSSL